MTHLLSLDKLRSKRREEWQTSSPGGHPRFPGLLPHIRSLKFEAHTGGRPAGRLARACQWGKWREQSVKPRKGKGGRQTASEQRRLLLRPPRRRSCNLTPEVPWPADTNRTSSRPVLHLSLFFFFFPPSHSLFSLPTTFFFFWYHLTPENVRASDELTAGSGFRAALECEGSHTERQRCCRGQRLAG